MLFTKFSFNSDAKSLNKKSSKSLTCKCFSLSHFQNLRKNGNPLK